MVYPPFFCKKFTEMKNTARNKLQLPRLMKPVTQRVDVPFEKYQHFVVAPVRPPEVPYQVQSSASSTNSVKEKEVPEEKTSDVTSARESVVVKEEKTQVHSSITPFEVSISKEQLDMYILEASNTTVQEATEKFISQHFGGETAIYWENIPELQLLYSTTYQVVVPRTESIASSAFFTKSIIRTNSPHNHPAFSKRVDIKFAPDDCPMMALSLIHI